MRSVTAGKWMCAGRLVFALAALAAASGCRSVAGHRAAADKAAERIIRSTQEQALGRAEAVEVESAADTLRRRLLLDQQLIHRGPASLGIHDLPDSDYWDGGRHLVGEEAEDLPRPADGPLTIALLDGLQISARNSRDYQQAKEDLFRAALDLDLERDAFRHTFSGMLSGTWQRDGSGEEAVESAAGTGEIGVTRKFLTGIELSSRIAVDLVKLLTQDRASSLGILADATVSLPLLGGAGRRIAGEPLQQAERDMLYAVYEFERFKRTFAVRVATEYFDVLQARQQVQNVEENYRRLVAARRRARRLADSGRLPEFQYDQAVQDELRARTRWIQQRNGYASRLDGFKLLLGLPPDAGIELDPSELDRLGEIRDRFAPRGEEPAAAEAPPADAPVVLPEPDRADAGPLELEPAHALRVALDSRLDLRIIEEKIEDAQRDVYVAADALRAGLTLRGAAQAGERRSSASSATEDDARIELDRGVYSAVLDFDLPFERTAERNAYRNSLMALEQAIRGYQELEDQIKLAVLSTLRDLRKAREDVGIQVQAVTLAEKRVRSTDLFLQAGRAQIRDVLESQESLLNAQNGLTAAVVDYRIAELRLQRDLGVLLVSRDGLWEEYSGGGADGMAD